MRLSAETRVTIQAPAEVVWNKLSDLQGFPRWNSRTHFDAPPRKGIRQPMKVRLFGLWLKVPVVIQTCDIQNGLRWQGGIPGIYTGSHYFRIEDTGQGHSRLIQGEDFAGLLVPILWPLLKRELYGLYEAMNAEIKAACEAA